MRLLVLTTLLCALPAWAEPPAAAPAPVAPRRLGLYEAIDWALRSDPTVAAAVIAQGRGALATERARLDRFSLKVDGTLSEQWQILNLLGPTLSYTDPTTGLTVKSPEQTPHTWIGAFNFSGSLRVPIFAGHRVTATIARAGLLEDAARAATSATARSVALDVLRSYWGVRRVEMQREVSQRALERYQEAVQVVSARIRAGLAPPVDLNRIESRRQREVARLVNLEGVAREGRAQLAVALGLGRTPIELTELAVVPEPPPADSGQVEGLLDDAVRGRAEIAVARRQTEAARQAVVVARAGYYPQLTGFGLAQWGNSPYIPIAGYTATDNDSWKFWKNMSGSFFVGATLNVNLFDTWNTRTQVRDARYEVSRLHEEERRVGRIVELDVRVAHAKLLRLYDSRGPLAKSAEVARDTLDIIERRYKSGDALILDYLDAQLELLGAEIDLVDSTAAIAQAWGELWAATGRIPGAPARGRGP
ncbi:MAG TPA: TolC family protein [Polyangia bacterium]|jgi:outer membrane protein TolC